jgi:four helix bundle protein
LPRLRPELLIRVEDLSHRVVDVADSLGNEPRYRRVIDQITGSGTSVGANVFEADEAMTSADFVKCLCIAVKELNETRFWLRFVTRRGWVKPERLTGLELECNELRKILGTMIARTKDPAKRRQPQPGSI